MGFLGGQKVVINDYEYDYDERLDVMLIKKTVREDYEISQTIKKIAKKEIEQSMVQQNENLKLILERLDSLEKQIQEMGAKQEHQTCQENALVERLASKKYTYKDMIEELDEKIDCYYGKIARKGGEVDKSIISPMEKEIKTYQKKLAILEPILEALNDEGGIN